MNNMSHDVPMSNGSVISQQGMMQRSPQGTSFNGTSFEIIDHSPSSSTGNRTPQDLSYLNPVGLGQISITDVTLEQALEKVQDLMKENKELRDYLKENNEMMRQQYQTLSEWKEKIHDSNKVNKEKFEETRRVILQLRDENAQLKERLQVHDDMQTEATKLNVKVKELEHTTTKLAEDISVKDSKIYQLQEQLQELTLQSQNVQSSSSKSETIYVAHSEDEEVKIQTLTEERNKQANIIVELKSQLQALQQNIEKLQYELQESQKIRETVQSESDRYLRESEELSSKIESILGDMKTLRSENKSLKNEKLQLELKMDELQRKVGSGSTKGLAGTKAGDKWDFPSLSSGEEMVAPPEESRPERPAVLATSAVQTSYGKDEVKEIQTQLNQKELQVDQLLEELRSKEHELSQYRECQNRQQQSKISPDHDKLGPKTTYLLNAPASDLHSLRSQNMSLMTEITDTQSKLEAAKQAMDKRNNRVAELEEAVKRVNDDLMKQRNEDGAMIQSLKMTLGNYEQALNAERKEHQNTKKQMADLRQAYNSLMTDYKSVLHGYEALKQEKSHQGDGEKKQMLSEIGRLTAQILSAEESINYRDTQLQELRKENDKLKEEVQTIPVLNAQADVWKVDFQAERDAREAEHSENERLKQEINNLRLQNQQLIDESHNYSKAQFTEMQRKYAQAGQHSHQQQLQGHLRVGGTAGPPVGYQVHYPNQYHHGYPNRENADGQMLQPLRYPHPGPYPGTSVDPPFYPPQQQTQVHQQQQAEEDYQPLSCPKCNLVCPDVDTLQIHVLDCIEH